LGGILNSCEYFKGPPAEEVIARVNDHYLYRSDIKDLVSENTSSEDSTLIVNNYINQWGTRHLLIDQALVNLDQEHLDRFEKLVQEYKNDLYTEAYKNAVVSRQLDSSVTEREYLTYYEENSDNFRLNDELLLVRYVHLAPNYDGVSDIKERLNRFEKEDQEALSDKVYSFVSSNLNDSIWIRKDNLLRTLPILKEDEQVLKKSNFVQLQDSLGVYLVKTVDMLGINEVAPMSYIEPTLKQIILNQRRLKLISKFERDITRDAIENNKFQIYTYE
jgi:hypothetical protein